MPRGRTTEPTDAELAALPVKTQAEKYPWLEMERRFVEGVGGKGGILSWPTLSEMSDEYGCAYSHLRRKMHERDWVGKRRQFQEQTQQLIRERAIENYVKAAAYFDAISLDAAQQGIEHALMHFREADANGKAMPQVELDRLGRALVNFQRMGRLALGLSTENNATKQETTILEDDIDLTKLNDQELSVLEILAQRLEARTKVIPAALMSTKDIV